MLPMPEYFRRDIYPRLPELIKMFGSVFHFYHKPGIMRTGREMNGAFNEILYRQYFAVKACPEPCIMEFLFKELGFGFDCSSIAELVMARSLGAKPDDIIYSSNDTSSQEFAYATKRGGCCMLNLDDISFVPLVSNFPNRIFFRLNPGKLLKTPKGNVIGNPFDSKYGITYEQIIPAYKAAVLRGAREFGIHIMVASNDRTAHHFADTARFTLEVAAMLYRKLHIMIRWIDIGGGFGIPYRPTDPELHIGWIGQRITKLFYDFAGQFGWMPRLMTECGRFVTGPHGILVNPVLHVMQKYRYFIGVAAAMTGCPRPAFYGSYHHQDVLTPKGNLRRGKRRFTNVVGPKCENWDRLTATDKERLLPCSVRSRDIHVTANCGAHSGPMADNYNGRTRLMGLLDQDGSNENVIVIRQPEKVRDLFSNVVFPAGAKRRLARLLRDVS